MTRYRSAVLLAACLASTVTAQPAARNSGQPAEQDAPEPLEDNRYIKYSDHKEWIVESTYRVFPDGRFTKRQSFPGWTYTEFTAILPYTERTGTAYRPSHNDAGLIAGLYLNSRRAHLDRIPTRTVPGTNATYATVSVPGTINFSVAIAYIRAHMTCVETKFDEKAAWDIPWPESFADAQGWLERDPTFDTVPDGQPDFIAQLVERWTGGNDTRTVPPVQLAKYLTACVTEHLRTSGPNRESPLGPAGYVFYNLADQDAPQGVTTSSVIRQIGGLIVRNAADTAREGKGSEHELVNMLTAVLRVAGIPARTVIGIDNDESGDDEVRSWVEFAVRPPDLEYTLWIPIDVWELEKDGKTTRDWQRPWKHFGTTEELRNTPPIAHYFHPPANYRSYHRPGLYGIQSLEELPAFGSQALSFQVNGAPNRGGRRGP